MERTADRYGSRLMTLILRVTRFGESYEALSIDFILLLLFSPSVSLVAQTLATPTPSPPSLRSPLLSELYSTHDKAEWFTPMNTAVAADSEQEKRVPKNAERKLNPNANRFVRMLAYHLDENALARLGREKLTNPSNNDETFNDFDPAH